MAYQGVDIEIFGSPACHMARSSIGAFIHHDLASNLINNFVVIPLFDYWLKVYPIFLW